MCLNTSRSVVEGRAGLGSEAVSQQGISGCFCEGRSFVSLQILRHADLCLCVTAVVARWGLWKLEVGLVSRLGHCGDSH